MLDRLFRQNALNAGATLSLMLVDTLEAMRYDSYVYRFLNDSGIDYKKYTLVFGFDYENDTHKLWKVFVFSDKNKWELMEMPNPFCKTKSNQAPDASLTDNLPNCPVSQSEEIMDTKLLASLK